jgi:hypothetical protein
MADEEHLALIREGVDAWNAWRLENPHIREADLREADLSGANLRGADLLKANLLKANLLGANLDEAVLSGTVLDKESSGFESVEPRPDESRRLESVEPQSDEPTTNDQLGRRPFAQALVERMDKLYEKGGQDGFAAHLHAPWGAGKTSILLMMRDLIASTETFYAKRKIDRRRIGTHLARNFTESSKP